MKILTKTGIQQEREALKKRLLDLDAAERVLDSLGATSSISGGNPAAVPPAPSIKRAILDCAASANGTNAKEIAEYLHRWMPDFPVKNISPKLSLYKSEEFLELKNGRWLITDEGRRELNNSKN